MIRHVAAGGWQDRRRGFPLQSRGHFWPGIGGKRPAFRPPARSGEPVFIPPSNRLPGHDRCRRSQPRGGAAGLRPHAAPRAAAGASAIRPTVPARAGGYAAGMSARPDAARPDAARPAAPPQAGHRRHCRLRVRPRHGLHLRWRAAWPCSSPLRPEPPRPDHGRRPPLRGSTSTSAMRHPFNRRPMLRTGRRYRSSSTVRPTTHRRRSSSRSSKLGQRPNPSVPVPVIGPPTTPPSNALRGQRRSCRNSTQIQVPAADRSPNGSAIL